MDYEQLEKGKELAANIENVKNRIERYEEIESKGVYVLVECGSKRIASAEKDFDFDAIRALALQNLNRKLKELEAEFKEL